MQILDLIKQPCLIENQGMTVLNRNFFPTDYLGHFDNLT